jgi:hypothetical protein
MPSRWMAPSLSARRKDLLHVPKLLEGLKTWLQSMNDASAPDAAVRDTLEKPVEAATPVESSARLQSGAIVGIFALLVFYFLYFASPILIPIITALLLSMLLAPFVRLLELVHVPRALGSLIVVVAAVGALVVGPPLNWQWTRGVLDHRRHRPPLLLSSLRRHFLEETGVGNSFAQRQEARRRHCQKY